MSKIRKEFWVSPLKYPQMARIEGVYVCMGSGSGERERERESQDVKNCLLSLLNLYKFLSQLTNT